jgi:predicted DsbA family dithiol-disulfide isomerase
MRLDIYQDLICPWCYIGKHRLQRALAERPRLTLQIEWMPFQLNPTMPRGGMDRRVYLASKFGGAERARHAYSIIAETAARDGLVLDLERIRRTPNTLDAHRLVRFAMACGISAMDAVERLFRAYFGEALDIGDRGLLAELAEDLGCDRAAARAYLESEEGAREVAAADAVARQAGIQAVPCFVFDRRYAVSGAQEPMAFHPLFDLAAAGEALAAASSA